MVEASPMCQINAFVVRFYLEWSPTGRRRRGRITHVPSGQCANFADLDEMLAFMRRFGVLSERAPAPRESGR